MNEQNSGSKTLRNKRTIAIAVVLGIAVSAVLGLSAVSVLAQENGDVKAKPEIEGSANIGEVIKNFIEENRKVSFVGAAETAESALSESKVVHGNFGVIQGYLVYTFLGVDNEEQQKYKIIIDAGNGEILYQSDPIQMKEGKKFHVADVSAELDLSEAASIAQAAVENGVVNMGMLRAQDDNAVYTFLVTDSEQGTKYFVTIDADSGEVLDVSEGMAKPWGFHGKHHFGFGHGHKAYSDKDRESSEDTRATGEQV
jgi:uncharacterized membrane protein YkoI